MKIIRALVATLAIAMGVIVIGASPARADGCDWNSTDTDATLNTDGSMDVVETVGYDFSGTCHGGIRYLDPPGSHVNSDDLLGSTQYSVSEITVTENGIKTPIADSSPGYVKWGSASRTVSGKHSYVLTYHVDGAVAVAPDVAVLYWQFVGTGFPDQDHVTITIHTPGFGEGLKVFVHGILDGVSKVSGNEVGITTPNGNPAGTPIEVRLLEPSSDYLVPPVGEPIGDQILAQEKVNAEQANGRRAQLLKDEQAKADRRRIANVAAPITAGMGFIGFMFIFLQWGKEPHKPDDVGDYYREVDQMDPPAVCQCIVSFGTPPNDAFGATLVDLAQRGWL
ncbi:MAG: hypothetical protein QOE63_714, partial [Acidimicrobiaceae bacterium]